jgi:hypothetical protein
MRRYWVLTLPLAYIPAAGPWHHHHLAMPPFCTSHIHDVASVIGLKAMYTSFGDIHTFLGRFGLRLATGLFLAEDVWRTSRNFDLFPSKQSTVKPSSPWLK